MPIDLNTQKRIKIIIGKSVSQKAISLAEFLKLYEVAFPRVELDLSGVEGSKLIMGNIPHNDKDMTKSILF